MQSPPTEPSIWRSPTGARTLTQTVFPHCCARAVIPTLPTWPYLERYRNEGTRAYSPHAAYTECKVEYQPTVGLPAFDLPTWELPLDALRVWKARPSADLARCAFPGDGVVRFYVHPQMLADRPDDPYLQRTLALGRRCPPALVSPSASTRTLFVHGDPLTHALKVHFPFRVSRYERRMRGEVIEQAVVVSNALEAWTPRADPGFAFLPEVIGVSHPVVESDPERGENWGYLVRDLTPFPRVGDARRLVPGFALYGRDAFDDRIGPLLLDLADDADPAGWTLETILLPIVRHWIACYRDLGFILEPHGQNLLLELDAAGAVTRLVHRDLSVGIDMRRRRELGLPDGGLNDYNRFDDGIFASIAFDRFVGTHFFEFLVQPLLDRDPRLSLNDFRSPCRSEFERLFPDHARYLPRTIHYFSEVRDSFGKPLYEDTGDSPTWRP